MSYYDRTGGKHTDGTMVFASQDDVRSEEQVARMIESAWRCQLRRFGALSPLDWFAVRDERVVGLVELKTRNHDATTYPTVFLNLRKWMALMLTSSGFGVPPVFVVRFNDGVRYIDVRDVPCEMRIAGCRKIVKSISDIEPVVDVPVGMMKPLGVAA